MVIKDKQSECGQPRHRFQMSQFWSIYTETQPWSFQTKTGSAAFSKVSIFEGQKFWSSVNNWHNAPFTRGVQRLSFTLNGVTLRTELWVCHVASMALLAAEVENFKCQRSRQPIRSPYANTLAQRLANPIHTTPEKYVIGCCHYDGASAPSFRHALRQAWMPTPRVNGAKLCILKRKHTSVNVA